MEKNKDIKSLIEDRRKIINQKLYDFIEFQDEPAREIMKYTCFNGAHRWRPILLILTYEIYKPFSDDILPFACAIEIIHNASLILDDLPCMDNANLRRNIESCHLKFSEEKSILVGGTYMVSLAYNLVKENRKAIEELNLLIKSLIEGQLIDLSKDKEKNILNCYEKKTGALFSCAAKLGGILAGAPLGDIKLLGEYGNNLGISYQFSDDIKDGMTDKEKLKEKDKYYKKAKGALEKLSKKSQALKDFLDYVITH